MSTILKALKKVEGKREATAAKAEIPRALKSPIIKKSRSWSKRIVAIALFLVVAVGAAAGYRFWQSGKEIEIAYKPADEIKTPENKVKKPIITNSVEKHESESVESAMKASSGVRDLSVKVPETSKKHASPNRLTETTIQSPPVVVDSPPEKPVAQERNRPSVKKQTSNSLIEKTPKRVTAKPQMISKASVEPGLSTPIVSPAENPPEVDIPLLEDRSLEIQALVYSEDSAKRMIVLNGEILRQGYEYKGYTIETIESQRVLVKKQGKVSALLFGK